MSGGVGGAQRSVLPSGHRGRALGRRAIASALVVVSAGFSAVSSASPAGAATVPGKPGTPVVKVMNGAVALQWTAPTSVGSPPLTGYRVEKNSAAGWTAAAPEVRVDAITAGGDHTCALLRGGSVKCWGSNYYGQLGLGNRGNRGVGPGQMGNSLPAVALGTGRKAVAISAGAYHTCALLDNGTVKCWGLNGVGQLGLGDVAARGDGAGEMGDSLPAVALGTGRKAVAISTVHFHTCALLDNGSVKCWGANEFGALGLGNTANRGDGAGEMGDNLPAVALGTGRRAVAIRTLALSSCALLDNATVKCWGYNTSGLLGTGDTAHRGDGPGEMGDQLPAVALGTGRTAVGIGGGGGSACAVLDNGTVKCWGSNYSGALGLGDTASRGDEPGEMGDALPTVQLGAGRTASSVSTGTGGDTCALLNGGTVKCWGFNQDGKLGLGDIANRGDAAGEMGDSLPAVALGTGRKAVAISAGFRHSCALLDDATVKCWGYNKYGQLGLGDMWSRGDAGQAAMGNSLLATALGTVNVVSTRAAVVRVARGTYQFRVVALSSAGAGPPSNASSAAAVLAVPGAPTQLTAAPGNRSVSLTWAAPLSDGGSPVTSYLVTILNSVGEVSCCTTPTTRVVGPAVRSLTWAGLYNGSHFKFKVVAVNAVGAGAPIQLANVVIPVALASAPRSVYVNAGVNRITVNWRVPEQNGGSTITSYQLRVFNASGGPAMGVTGPTTRSVPVPGPGAPPYYNAFDFTGLTLGTVYTFTVAAVTALGTGQAAVTPAIAVGSPGAPTIVDGVPGPVGPTTGSVIVTVGPGSDNGSPITGYTVTCIPSYGQSGVTGTQTGDSPLTVSGLTIGLDYSCAVQAINARGTGGPSYVGGGIVGAPAAPTEVVASSTGVHGELSLAFVAPDDHGSPITKYIVECLSGPDTLYGYAEGAASPIMVTGLSAGNWYQCLVRAQNARGLGPYSELSTWALV